MRDPISIHNHLIISEERLRSSSRHGGGEAQAPLPVRSVHWQRANYFHATNTKRKVYVMLYTCIVLMSLSMWFTVVLVCSVSLGFCLIHVSRSKRTMRLLSGRSCDWRTGTFPRGRLWFEPAVQAACSGGGGSQQQPGISGWTQASLHNIYRITMDNTYAQLQCVHLSKYLNSS